MTQNLFKQNFNNWFIETGTCSGDGVQSALDAGFKNIISLELSRELHDISKDRFNGNENVRLILGNSKKILSKVISSIDEPITFWLDAHYSGGTVVDSRTVVTSNDGPDPLMDELRAINGHHLNTHTIMIDDYIHFRHEAIMSSLWDINPDYILRLIQIEGRNDIVLASL